MPNTLATDIIGQYLTSNIGIGFKKMILVGLYFKE